MIYKVQGHRPPPRGINVGIRCYAAMLDTIKWILIPRRSALAAIGELGENDRHAKLTRLCSAATLESG